MFAKMLARFNEVVSTVSRLALPADADSVDKAFDGLRSAAEGLIAENDSLRARNSCLTKALEFYASQHNWEHDHAGVHMFAAAFNGPTIIERDCGSVALDALNIKGDK